MEQVIKDSYAQGGAVLLLIVLLVLALICTFRYIVAVLWKENQELRNKLMEMNERVVRMGEASKATNEKTIDALTQTTTAFKDMAAELRGMRG